MVVQTIVLLLSCLAAGVNPDNDLGFTIIYIVFYLWSLFCIWKGNGQRVSPYILFYLTMGLFLGGRFWDYLLNFDQEIFSLDWFAEINLTYEKKQRLMYYLLSMTGLMNIGYLYMYGKDQHITPDPPEDDLITERLRIILRFALFIIAPLVIITGYKTLSNVNSLGYVFLYEQQDEQYASFTGLANIFLVICMGLVFGFNVKELKKYYLGVYILLSFFNIMMGARGTFGALLLYLLLIYSLSYRVTVKKLLTLLGGGVVILIFLFGFSIRAMENDLMRIGYDSTFDVLTDFISGQGISLMVFDASQLIDNYPTIAYVQSLVPGASFFWHLFSGEVVDASDNNFANFMCVTLNPGMYKLGFGLGWSIMSDLYLFGFKSFFGFCALSLLFGLFLAFQEIRSKKSLWMRSLLFATTPALLMLPRSSMNSYVTLIIYCVIIFGIMKFIVKREEI